MTDIHRYFNRLKLPAEKFLLPLLLCFEVMKIIINTYVHFYTGWISLGFALYAVVLFFVFEKLKPKKIFRGIIYIAMVAAVIFFGQFMLRQGWSSSGVMFTNWFYVNSQEVGQVAQYQTFVIVCLGFFIVSVVYYFTVLRYRTFGIMLVILFPFVIYGKRADTIPVFDITVMLTLFLALIIHSRLTADDVKHDTRFNFSYVIAGLVFVTFVGAVVMFLPKPEIKSYLENNKNFFDLRIQTDLSELSDLNDTSSDRFGGGATGELLFNLYTDSDEEIFYLRRQSFDFFYDNRWQNNAFSIDGIRDGYDVSADNVIGSTKYYYELMKKLAQTGRYDKYGLTAEKYSADFFSENQSKYIYEEYTDSFRPDYICADLNIDVSRETDFGSEMIKSTHSEVYPVVESISRTTFSSFNFYPQTRRLEEFAAGLDFGTEEFITLINEAYINGDISSYEYGDLTLAQSFYCDNNTDEISDRVKQLAQTITAGSKNDYQKAAALVNYFATNEFTYDMEYIPDDESIEYFLFDSKTGSCTSYATAMALMARSVGLPCRYVEGFAAYEKAEENSDVFTVKDSNAHAFVECYIAGVGWMTFDPTVAQYMNESGTGNAGEIISSVINYLGRAALFIGAGFVVIFVILIDYIYERFFRIRLYFKALDRKPVLLYQRVVRLLELCDRKHLAGYSPKEICEYAMVSRNCEIKSLVKLFERTCFGGYTPDEEEFKEIYRVYKTQWKILAKGMKKTEKAEKS